MAKTLAEKAWKVVVDYFSIYRLSNIKKKLQTIGEIVIVGLLTVLCSFLILPFSSALIKVISTNIGSEFYSFVVGLLAILILFGMLLLAVFLSITKKSSIYIAYGYLIFLVFVLVFNLPYYVQDIYQISTKLLFILIVLPIIIDRWKTPDWKIVITLTIILLCLTIGLEFINEIFGRDTTSIMIFDNNPPSIFADSFHNTCYSPSHEITAGKTLYCHFLPSFTNISGNLTIFYSNGSKYITSITKDNTSFFAQNEIEEIIINITATDENVSFNTIKTSYPLFITKEESKSRITILITYILGLLYLCLFIIPQKINELWK